MLLVNDIASSFYFQTNREISQTKIYCQDNHDIYVFLYTNSIIIINNVLYTNVVSQTQHEYNFHLISLQMFYLTLGIRAAWGTYLSELSDVYKLSMMNTQSFDLGK